MNFKTYQTPCVEVLIPSAKDFFTLSDGFYGDEHEFELP